jgi:hypothetical protein
MGAVSVENLNRNLQWRNGPLGAEAAAVSAARQRGVAAAAEARWGRAPPPNCSTLPAGTAPKPCRLSHPIPFQARIMSWWPTGPVSSLRRYLADRKERTEAGPDAASPL